jgi:predicted short-subunit dehydrogenase-like oxidoreductase (DUF2520 family)
VKPVVAHCAGSLDLSPLLPFERAGMAVGSFHPLQAVPTPTTVLSGFVGIDGSREARRLLSRIARDLGLTPLEIPGGDRALYHAAAAIASNGLVALASRACALLSRAGAPPKKSLPAVLTLMRSALDGVARKGLVGGLTGPIARGDLQTLKSHRRALEQKSPQDVELYRSLSLALLELAVRLEPRQRALFRKWLPVSEARRRQQTLRRSRSNPM